MALQTINVGTAPNDGRGDPLRAAMQKTNANFLQALIKDDNLSGLADLATARGNLGLGSAATHNVGISGATVPLLNGVNTYSAPQAFAAPVGITLGSPSGNSGLAKFYGAIVGDVSVKVADSSATGVVFQLPADNGAVGQVLQTDGAGATSWVAPAGTIMARLVTTGPLPANTYSNGSSGINAFLQGLANGALTVDGGAVATNDVVLVMAEVTAAHNGLYTVTMPGDAGTPYFLTRHTSMNQAATFSGALVSVGDSGVALANSLWLCDPALPVVVGTTDIPFAQLGGPRYTAGSNISIIANAISVSNTTGSGQVVLGTSPTLSAPNLGAATAQTINGYSPIGLVFGSM